MSLTKSLLTALGAVIVFQSILAQAQTPSATAVSSSSSSSSSLASKPELTDDDKRLIAQGYKIKYDKGTKLFCKLVTDIGSRFQKSVCQTAPEIQAKTQVSQDAFDPAKRPFIGPSAH